MKTKIFIFCGFFLCLMACKNDTKFTISGNIQNATDSILYIEQTGLTKTIVLDSVKIKKSGDFKFRCQRPNYPDLYRLRMGKQLFVFCIDSCEHISISTVVDSLAFPQTITGSYKTEEIQQLRRSVLNMQRTYNRVAKKEVSFDSLQNQITTHKQMAQKIILENPRSIVAYYALFQKVGNYFLFSPYEKADRPYCSAVATAYHTFLPDYNRSKNLYNLVLDAIKAEREVQRNAYMQELIDNAETSRLDIELPNIYGGMRSLSELEGKVVLLDFSAYEAENSIAYTFNLRDLYNQFASQNFEIYQVSADRNQLLWEESVKNLPWVCVRGNSIYEQCFSLYNVQTLPTTFLLNKKGAVMARNVAFDKLPAEIEKLLKQ